MSYLIFCLAILQKYDIIIGVSVYNCQYGSLTKREIWAPLFITILFLALSLILHKLCNSTMWQDHDMWDYRLKVHVDAYPFGIRHFTSFPILLMRDYFGWPVRETFFALQFSLGLCLGLGFYYYLRALNFNKTWSNVGLVLLLTAYPIMGAHFEPVFTWDDFWAYLFSVIAFTFIIRRRFIYAGLFFLLGCLAREQTIFLFPAYALGVFFYSGDIKWYKKIIYMFSPLLLWGAYYVNVAKVGDPNRFKYLTLNFKSFEWARDNVFSWFISFGFMWLISTMAWFRLADHKKNRRASLVFWGFILAVPVNTVFTFWMTLARETRIFFPPFIFVIPLALVLLIPFFKYFSTYYSTMQKISTSTLFAMICLGSYFLIANIVFPEFMYRQGPDYCQIWAAVNLTAAFFIFAYYLLSRKFRSLYGEFENEWCK